MPGSSTVAILAQGTHWAVAVMQAFCLGFRNLLQTLEARNKAQQSSSRWPCPLIADTKLSLGGGAGSMNLHARSQRNKEDRGSNKADSKKPASKVPYHPKRGTAGGLQRGDNKEAIEIPKRTSPEGKGRRTGWKYAPCTCDIVKEKHQKLD